MTRFQALLFLSFVGVLASSGCATAPLDVRVPRDARVVELLGDYTTIGRSPRNRYAVLIRGQEFRADPDRPFRISTNEDVKREGHPVPDPYIAGDQDQLTRLLASKGYDVYRADMGELDAKDVRRLLEKIAILSDGDTQVFVSYSGEGDAKGLRTRTLEIGPGRHLVAPNATLAPDELVGLCSSVRGSTAVLLNACESGVFAEAARKNPDFRGVLIAACGVGFATTPHEPAGTSAIVASFLDLYRDDPGKVTNLSSVRLERAGGRFTNIAHHWSDFWGGAGLPISYLPVVYASADFLL